MLHGRTETKAGRSAERPTRFRTGKGGTVKEEGGSQLLQNCPCIPESVDQRCPDSPGLQVQGFCSKGQIHNVKQQTGHTQCLGQWYINTVWILILLLHCTWARGP